MEDIVFCIPQNDQSVVLEISNVEYFYRKYKALDSVSCKLESGYACALLGHNGAGKTTLIKIVSGLIKPNSGYAKFYNSDVWNSNCLHIKKNIGVLFESNGLYENLTAWDNLVLVAKIFSADLFWESIAINLLKNFDLFSRRQEIVRSWSAGMKRKLAIVRTFITSPQLVILDEPTKGLDPISKINLRSILNAYRLAGGSALFATQEIDEAERLADYIIIMKNGKQLFFGSCDSLRHKHNLFSFQSNHRFEFENIRTLFPSESEFLAFDIVPNGTIFSVIFPSNYVFTEELKIHLVQKGVIQKPVHLEDIYYFYDQSYDH
ncbi:MAG: ABC transporter ATP-binding protein [Bacteroidales bacterium]|jgi:ABC-2 type transport system ATP-binding protein|nr:ABC transporter ATP-binding protein [Bacteroidales bacterium]